MVAQQVIPKRSKGRLAQPYTAALVRELRQLIADAQCAAAVAVNMSLTALYWRIGKRIREESLGEKRAQYGEQIVATVSRQLVREYGRGFEEKNLRRMVQFAEAFPDERIVATLWRQLSWSHFRELLPLKRPLQREFYAEMCRVESWSVRTLASRIDILCAQKKTEQVELLELNAAGVHVAEYLTVLPARALLHKRLQAAIESARARFGANVQERVRR